MTNITVQTKTGTSKINLELEIEFGDDPESIKEAFEKMLDILEKAMTPAEFGKFGRELVAKMQAELGRMS